MVTPTAAPAGFVLGRDVGRYGRAARVLAGIWLVLAGGGHLVGASGWHVAELLGYVVALTLLYTAAAYLLGRHVLARLNPWTGTTLLLVPIVAVAVLDTVDALPAALPPAGYVYVGVSLVLTGVVGYGGCEVVGVPVVVLRHRFPVYCAMNALDAAERQLTATSGRTAGRIAGVPALLGGVFYFLAQPLLGLLGVALPFDPRVPVVLFAPAMALSAYATWVGVRGVGWSTADPAPRGHGLAALGLALTSAGILVFGSILFAYVVLTGVIFAGGIIAGVRQVVGQTRDRADAPRG